MKKQIFVLIAIYLLTTAISFAATLNNPIGDSKQRSPLIVTGEFFSNYVLPGTSYVFDETGSTTKTDGELFLGFYPQVTLFVKVTVNAATSIDIAVYGRSDDDNTRFGIIYTKSFVVSTSDDFVIPLAEHLDWVAVGVKLNGSTSATDKVWVNFTARNNQ